MIFNNLISNIFMYIAIIDPGINLIETINILKKFVGESIPIVDFKKNILGIITESDVLTAYSNISDEIKNIEKH